MRTGNNAPGLIICVGILGQALQPQVQRPHIALLHDAVQRALQSTTDRLCSSVCQNDPRTGHVASTTETLLPCHLLSVVRKGMIVLVQGSTAEGMKKCFGVKRKMGDQHIKPASGSQNSRQATSTDIQLVSTNHTWSGNRTLK